ncbi:hypothetical protein HOLleu_20745 [Holothuria leucospilota]|uniref:Uncharacterized protein n=1 Tax=Holothuria leucospilota TaxID=206669 RepID=A0A9Q1C1Y4_HOLLE|nr:hypothetical protein HOLleu_20745 [Holothuria leucospilota]
MEFGKDSILLSRCLLLGTTLLSFFKGVSANDCPSEFPFNSCPRPLFDTPDDVLCCIIDYDDYACCSQSILTLWWVIVLCCCLLLVVLILTVVLCCICPCCLYASRRRSRQPQTTPATQQVIVNPPVPTEQPPAYSYSLQPYPADAPAIPNKGPSGDPANLP